VTAAKILDGAVEDAKLADAKLSLASGGTVAGAVRFTGSVICAGVKATTPTSGSPGIHLGQDSLNGNVGIEIATASTGQSYIDFTRTTVGQIGRIITNNATNVMTISSTGGIVMSNALTCNGGLTVAAGQTVTLGSVTYNLPTTGAGGQTWPSLCAVTSGGVLEIGKHIDFHDNSAEANDNDVRLTSAGSALSCSGSFAAVGLSSSVVRP